MDLIYRYDPLLPPQIESATDAAAAMRILCDGNRRLTALVSQMQQATLGEGMHGEVVVPICPVSLGMPIWAARFHHSNPMH